MLAGFQLGSFIGTTLAFFLIVGIAVVSAGIKKVNPFHKSPPRARVDKEFEARVSGERFSARAAYYAEYWGYKCEDVDIETEDGFILRLHHLTSPKHEKPGYPVILQHGILSNSVTFMVNEERSLAFWLLEQGYDVYVSNIRTNFGMPHRTYSNSDPRYYAWGVRVHCLPPSILLETLNSLRLRHRSRRLPCTTCLPSSTTSARRQASRRVTPVLLALSICAHPDPRTTLQPAYIGHSQGCGTMYIALSRGVRPDLGNKLACFISLAPAVYAGPALRKFPFSLMRKFAKSRKVWNLVFGGASPFPVLPRRVLELRAFSCELCVDRYLTQSASSSRSSASCNATCPPGSLATLPMSSSNSSSASMTTIGAPLSFTTMPTSGVPMFEAVPRGTTT